MAHSLADAITLLSSLLSFPDNSRDNPAHKLRGDESPATSEVLTRLSNGRPARSCNAVDTYEHGQPPQRITREQCYPCALID